MRPRSFRRGSRSRFQQALQSADTVLRPSLLRSRRSTPHTLYKRFLQNQSRRIASLRRLYLSEACVVFLAHGQQELGLLYLDPFVNRFPKISMICSGAAQNHVVNIKCQQQTRILREIRGLERVRTMGGSSLGHYLLGCTYCPTSLDD